MRLEELARLPLGHTTRSKVLHDLQTSYGQKGKEGWSLTEVLRLHRRDRARLLDLLNGIARGTTGAVRAQPYQGRFKIKTVDGQPFTLTRVRPDPESIPEVIVDAETGIAHHHPQQWVPIDYTIPPEVEMPIADEHNPANSAAWLLLQYGYQAREGGSNKRRWRKRGRGATGSGDRWLLVEEAFLKRNPNNLCKDLIAKAKE